jgi:hypothetical protein
LAVEHILGAFVTKAYDHAARIAWMSCYCNAWSPWKDVPKVMPEEKRQQGT